MRIQQTHWIIFLQGSSIRGDAGRRKSQPINKLAEIFGPISAPDAHSTISASNEPQPRRFEGRMMILKSTASINAIEPSKTYEEE